MHPKVGQDVSRVRPLRVLSRRPLEHLCVMREEEEPEWVDVEMLEDPPGESPPEGPNKDPIIENIEE